MRIQRKFKQRILHAFLVAVMLLPNIFYLPSVDSEGTNFQLTANSDGAFLVDNVTLQIDPTGTGNYVNINPNEAVANNTNVRLNIHWHLLDEEFLEYDVLSKPTKFENIPSSLYIPPGGLSGQIKGTAQTANVVFGNYVINENREIIIHWLPSIFQWDNKNGNLVLDTHFDFDMSQSEVTIGLPNSENTIITLKPKAEPVASISKKAMNHTYSEENGTLDWEILVNNEHQNLSNVRIKDILGDHLQFISAQLMKQEQGESNWTELPTGNFTEQSNAATVSWEILPKDELKRTAYKVIVKTKIIGDITKISNKASFSSSQKEGEEENQGSFDIVHQEFSKEIDKQAGVAKLDYYHNNGTAGTKNDYDYVILHWTIKIYYPIDGSKNDPIHDALSVAPANAGVHEYLPSSVQIIANNGQTDTQNFTKNFTAGNTKMDITPPAAPNVAKRAYTIKYDTKFTKNSAFNDTSQAIQLGNTATYADLETQSDGGMIRPSTSFGVVKEGRGLEEPQYNAERLLRYKWEIQYNTSGQKGVKNGKIVDSYIVYHDQIKNSFPGDLNGTSLVDKFKWQYFQRDLDIDSLVVKTAQGTILQKDVDYKLTIRQLDDENLLLPDGSKLYEGLNFSSGFEIELLGSYKESLDTSLKITFSTVEHLLQNKGYLRTWDMTDSQIEAYKAGINLSWLSTESFKWPGTQKYYGYVLDGTHNDPNIWFINPDWVHYNYAVGIWGANQEFSEGDVGKNQYTLGYLYNDNNVKKRAFQLTPGTDLANWDSVYNSTWLAPYLFVNVRTDSGRVTISQADNLKGIYTGIVTEPLVGFATSFNSSRSTMPVGTKFVDDLSHLETNLPQGVETSYQLIKDSIRVYESRAVQVDSGDHFLSTQGWETTPELYVFKEGVDYEVHYDETTKLLEVVFLKEHNKTFNVVFLMNMKHDNSYEADPLNNKSYKNTASLIIPGYFHNEVSTGEVQWQFDKKEFIQKTGEIGTGEESDTIFYTVLVNPNHLNFQQALVTDWFAKSSMTLLGNIHVYEGVEDGLGGFKKGTLLTEGVDYQLVPNGQIASMGTGNANSLPDSNDQIIQYWDRTDGHFIGATPPSNVSFDHALTADWATNALSNSNNELFQILFGDNHNFTNEEPRDNRTFLIEYATKVQNISANGEVSNAIGLDMFDGKRVIIQAENKTQWTNHSGEATGTQQSLTIQKKNSQGELLEGATFSLEKKRGGSWQSIVPSEALGQFVLNKTIIREHLTNGEYRLTEIHSPENYQTLSEAIYFKLSNAGFVQTNEKGETKDTQGASFSGATLTVLNQVEQRNLSIEKQWDFSKENYLVSEEDKEYYVVKAEVFREIQSPVTGGYTLDTKVAEILLNHGNDFKAIVGNLPVMKEETGQKYRYTVKEVEIYDSRNNRSILSNFQTAAGVENGLNSDTYNHENRTVTDSDGNYFIALKNILEEKGPEEYVDFGIEKQFIGDSGEGYKVKFELYRKAAGSDTYAHLQSITLSSNENWQWATGNRDFFDKKNASHVLYEYFIKEVEVTASDNQNHLNEFESTATDYTKLETVDKGAVMQVKKLIVKNTSLSRMPLPLTGGDGVLKTLFLIIGAITTGGLFLLWKLKIMKQNYRS